MTDALRHPSAKGEELYLSLGSNLGDREDMLRRAIALIGERLGTVQRVSSFIQTEPWGFDSPNAFLNAACMVLTEHSPLECLAITQQIERELGRTVKSTDGTYHDRPIDIDMLLYGNASISTPELTLPHPHMHERDFVMRPLREICPQIKIAQMKYISWNVNGLRAVVGKNFREAFEALDADFFCLQETKMQAGQLDLSFPGYESYWNYAEKKGYSGTAVFTRHTPLAVTYGLGIEEHDHEGRVITLEMQDHYLVCVYTPNSQDGLRRLDYRMQWEQDFRAYLLALDAKKPVIVCGDMNVAHQEIDLKNPKTNHMSAGFTDEERQKMTELLGSGFVDSFRHFHPDATDQYSWWSYRFHAREKNVGWRIDYFLVSERLVPQLQSATIHQEVMGSDHCPVELVL